MVCIYGLVDPISREIRYVGKSTNPHDRLKLHLSKKSLTTNSAKNIWLRSLLSKGLRPILVVLQSVPEDKWAEAERAWIVQGRMIGWQITNTSDGGEGVLPKTPETPTMRYKAKRPPAKLYPKKPKKSVSRKPRKRFSRS